MSGITGKVVVITGASSGIGEATALRLAERGAKLVLGARGPYRLTALVALATSRFGQLDVLVSNAGIAPIAPLDALTVSDWDAMIDTNIKGVLYGIAAALPLFRQQGFGHFVHTSSTAAHRIVPNMAVYAATKTAVSVISEGLRQEAGDKLRVTVISPGMTRTNIAATMADPKVRAGMTEAMGIAMPPDAIARAIVFAIEQPSDVDVGEIVVRPTAQG